MEPTGTPDPLTFGEAARLVASEVADLLERKRQDYGAASILNAPFGSEAFLLTMAWNKVARLGHLLASHKEPLNESVADSWRDLAGYAILGLLLERGCLALPLSNEENPDGRQ
ncbi:hypothetical protein FJZ36_08785 [Candidatus Poribacteria bacterium]|nr:hypothetical protein [Candidatus Poribacteria bacterium]